MYNKDINSKICIKLLQVADIMLVYKWSDIGMSKISNDCAFSNYTVI